MLAGAMHDGPDLRAAAWLGPSTRKGGRGDKTAIELFLAGLGGWDAGLRRRLDDGKSKPD